MKSNTKQLPLHHSGLYLSEHETTSLEKPQSVSAMEGDGRYKGEHIYLSLVYPINASKFVTVGLFEEHNYEMGVLFTQTNGNKQRRMLLEFSEWNYLLIFRERNTCMLLCEEDEERENKKSVTVKRNFGRSFVQITDSKNGKFVFGETEWTRFNSLLTLLNKYIVRLFYDQEHFKSYINQVVSMARYVSPSFFSHLFSNRKHSS